MMLNQFLETVRKAKRSQICTGFFNVHLKGNSDHTLVTIYKKEVCPRCHSELNHEITVGFSQPVNLSIFQAELLYALFVLNKRPADYANYHKCLAGQRFIESIVWLEV